MKITPKTDLRDAIYHNDDAARTHLESLLWPYGPVCPRCGVIGDRVTKLQGTSTRPGVFKCKDCRKPFSVTVGTVMERSHIPLSKWLMAAQIMSSSKKGCSALQLQRMISTNYETAWFLFHRLREAADALRGSGPIGGPGKAVEVDEVYIGGKESNKHASKRTHPGGGAVGKMPVVALVERDGTTRSFHVANVTAKTLKSVMEKHLSRESHLMTDESSVYPSIGKGFAKHSRVRHKSGEYVRGDAHVNTAESRFALFKRGVYGTFHNLSEAHLDRYLAEFDFRANTLGLSDKERCGALLTAAKGRRLLYENPHGQA